MRALIQRVSQCQVTVEGRTTGRIEAGLLVLLGITHDDGQKDMEWIIRKLIQLRIFNDEEGKMNRSVQDVQGGILVVSQFTLFANSKKGNRPSYTRSAPPNIAIPIYEQFLSTLKQNFTGPVATGEFGAMMEVDLINDGPVTIMLDSQQPDY